MMRRHSERGNIFFMLFGAVALVGVVAAATSTLMRGPLSTVVNVNARAKADTQMQIAAKLAMVRASQQSNPSATPPWSSGDCDSDGNVEPIPAKDASPKPQGGGQLPESIGASQQDPWGNAYGYCVWDIGTKNADAACAVGAGEVTRLKGDYNNNYPVMMIVSSGPDRVFQTQCNDWTTTSPGNDPLVNNYPTNYVGTMSGQHASAVSGDVIYKPVGSDDIVISYSYDQASQVAGGLWSLMKTDPNKITTNKDVDIQTNANFASGKTATFQGAANFDPGSRLDLGFGRTGADSGGLFKLPDQTSLTTCNSANNGALRLNTIATPNHNSLEVCDGLTGSPSWVAPSSTGITVTKLDDLTDAVASSVAQHKNLMLGDGTGLNFASSSTADNNVGVGIGSLSSLAAAGTADNVVVGSLSGTTLTTGSHNIIVGSALEAPTATTSGFLSIGNMIYATGMNGTGTTISAGNVGIGTANPNAKLQVAGATQATQFQFDANNYLGYSSGGDISLTYGGTAQLLANSNGIGIGISPAHLLDVNGDAYAQRFIATFSSASALPAFTFSGDVNTGIAHPSSGQIAFTLAGSEKAILTSTGLGIGVTSPSVALDVAGAGAFTTTVNAGTAFQFGSSNGMYNQGGNLSFNTGGAPRIYVTSVGLGVGLATPMVSLDAAGAIRPGTATDGSCTTGSYGAIRYGSGDALQYCSTDNNWYSLVASGGGGGGANLWTNNTTYITRANAHFINSGQTLPAALSSGGSRFFWYPDKSSFRAGGDGGTAWADGNIGSYSIGLGYDTEAKGNSSFAAGNNIAATGNYSFGIGQNLTASNTNSFALGNNSVASGTSAIAMGQKVTASGNYAMALGLGNSTTAPTVTGTDSFGIFMGDMSNKSLTGNNTMALLGGKFLIDSAPVGATSAMTGTLSLQVNGDAGAVQYCDNTGAYCFTAQSIATGAVGVFENASNVIRLTSGTVNYASANYVFGSPQLTDDGDATHRNRFYFIKGTGAFRAGGTTGTQWDTAGDHSIGLGLDTLATGQSSFAVGESLQAGGSYSSVFGHLIDVVGNNSTGFGLGNAAGVHPKVSGTSSYGIFMGDQSAVNFAAANTMGIFGGKLVIDPKLPATQLTARGVLDLGAATDAMVMPVGTTAQKPTGVNAVNGMIRYNTDNGKFEAYQAGAWQDILTSAVAGGAAAPDRGIQFNSGNNFAASSSLIYSSTGVLMVSGTYNGTVSVPATGAGSRMFFDPNTSSFRAGYVSGTQWDAANIGLYSTATGYNNKATGNYSAALGGNNTTSNDFAIAIGAGNTASGNRSMAFGDSNTASGNNSVVLGASSGATGGQAISIGYSNISKGSGSIVIGTGTTASGDYSIAMGNKVTVGNGTAGSGFGNYSGGYSFSSSTGTAPQVRGTGSFGLFMQDQSGVVFSSSSTMGLFGGKFVIDPASPSTYLAAQTALDVNGSIKISDGGEICATLLRGAIRYTSANTLQYCNGSAWTSTASSGTNVIALDDLSDVIVKYASSNMYLGSNSGATTTTAVGNTVLGSGAMTSVTTGGFNTALGTSSMQVVTSGEQNVAVGHESLFTNTTGSFNTALGRMALQANNASFNTATGFASLQGNTTGINNVGTGSSALVTNTIGGNNAAFGFSALYKNVGGSESTAIGSSAMLNANSNATAFITYNTAVGAYAMQGSATAANNIGIQNTAVGHSAMLSMTSGSQNVAVGTSALYLLSTGSSNTAVGQGALFQATSGSNNIAVGQYSMGTLSSGTDNVAVGRAAISDLTIGATNVAVGNAALNHVTGSSNVAVGHTAMSSLVSGSFNTVLGYNAGSNLTAGSNNIAIGNGINFANSTGSNQLNIANLLTGDVGSGLAYISSNAAVMLPVGTTAQRPLAGVTINGMIRYNNQSGKFEGYQGGAWQDILTSAVAGGAAAPDRGIQFNSGTNFAASSNFTYSSAGVLAATGTYTGVVSTVPSGAGARMVFDPTSGAFRAGYIVGATWDTVNIGPNSFAIGNSTKALGASAAAFNYFTTAPGPYSTALGNSTTANGASSIAMGQATTTGSGAAASLAAGYFTVANGNYSFAMGQSTIANGIGSMALGARVTAGGLYSTAIGFTSASGTQPQVSGTGSFGLFMGDQNGVNFAASSTMGLFGGKFVIDPNVPATQLSARGVLDLGAATDALVLPSGITAQRPGTAVNGMLRYNSANGKFEGYQGGAWQDILTSAVAGGAAAPDRGIQFNSGNSFAATSNLVYTASGILMSSGAYTGIVAVPMTGAGSRTFFDPASASFRAGYASGTQWDAANIGTYSFATGYNAMASGQYSVALGFQALATGQNAFAFGSSSATGAYSIAMGQNNFSSAANSIVIGGGSSVSGTSGITIGSNSSSTGTQDMIFGRNNTVSNTAVTAIGSNNTVGGDGSNVFGNNITVGTNQTNSLGLGNNVVVGLAGSNTSAALGLGTPAAGHYPRVGGSNSFGIFMGSQTDVHFDSSNAMGVFGGKMVVDPAVPATYLVPQTALDVHGSIKIGDGSETCSSTTAGAMRYTSAGTMQYCNSSTWTALVTGGTIVAAGVNTNIQFNSGGSFWGDSRLNFVSGSFINSGIYSGTPSLPATGAGSRMFFDPASGAFRAGYVAGTNWDATNIGAYSFAAGYDSKASGIASVALGSSTLAAGNYSFAAGGLSQANGDYSAVFGASNVLSSSYTFAAGYLNTVGGSYSTAFGLANTTTQTVSFTAGQGNSVTGSLGVALGQNLVASGINSFALGLGANANGTNSGALSFGSATGTVPKVSGTSSFGLFMGNQTGVNFASASTMGLFGGKFVIDPSVPATYLAAQTALDVNGSIKIGDGSETCSTTVKGAMRYTSGGLLQYCNSTAWTTLSAAGALTAGSDRQIIFNSGGTLTGSGNLTFVAATNTVAVTGAVSVTDRVSIAGTTGMSAPSGIALADLSDVAIGSPASGKVLTYNGTAWTATMPAGGAALNAITAATASQAGIDSGANTIVWNWNSLTTGTAMTLGSTSMTTGSILKLTNTNTAASTGTVLTINNSSTGLSNGIVSTIASTANSGNGATAVMGVATGTTGNTNGVWGQTSSTTNNSAGVVGQALGTSGIIYGVSGTTSSTTGTSAGVWGSAGGATGATYGVLGTNGSTTSGATAVYAQQTATSGNVNGLWATVSSTGTGASGIWGQALGTSGVTYGVTGDTASTTSGATGIYGLAKGTSGTTYGVWGTNASASGYGGYFDNTGSSGVALYASGGGTANSTAIFAGNAITLPASASRPSAAVNGMVRYNTSSANFEGYQNGSWLPFSSASAGSITAGADRQIIFNSGGLLTGNSGMTFSSAGIAMFSGANTGTASAPASGTGARMFFDPGSGAFRAGVVSSFNPTYWNAANLGWNSIAMGYDVKASNNGGIALGSTISVTGQNGVGIGQSLTVTGDSGVSIGYNNTIAGSSAVALGSGINFLASNDNSVALGSGITMGINDYNTIGLGNGVTINAPYAGALGLGQVSSGSNPIVSGISSFGIFMGDQKNVVFASANSMGLFGGKFVIDPGVQATYLYPRTALDVNGSIKVGDGSETCSSTTKGAIRYTSVNTLQYCNSTAWTLTNAGATATAAGANTQIQYNSGGSVFGASANYTYDYTNNILTIANSGTGSIRAGAGTAVLPSLSFAGDTDTGLFNGATNTLDATVGGGEVLQFASTALGVNYFKMTAGTAANGPILTNAGSATNGAGLSLNINAKTATAAGVGGAVNITGGGGNGANAGGVAYMQAGTGGATGNGGDATLSGGLGGSTSGTGGQASLIGGNGNGAGGVAYVAGGNGAGANAGGNAYLQGGGGGTSTAAGGGVYIAGGAGGATSGAGGPAFVTGGNSTSGAGGNITVGAGTTAAGAGGSASFYATDGVGGSNAGGAISMGAGDSLGATTGGAADIFAGTTVSGIGGGASLNAGYGGTTGAGGTVSIIAGAGGGTSGNGGNVVLTAGSVTSGTAGSILGKIGATTYMTIQPPSTTSSSVVFGGTGAITLPIGNTSQEPSTGVDGMVRYNSQKLAFEGRQNGSWLPFSSASAGATAAAGSSTYVQFNSAGILSATSNFTWTDSTGMLSVSKGYQFAGTTVFTYPKAATDVTGLAIGPSALAAQTVAAGNNVAIGASALTVNTTGVSNTAVGYKSLFTNGTTNGNTAVGYEALQTSTGGPNTALGYIAGQFISTGAQNTAIGTNAMEGIVGTPLTGNANTAVGDGALLVAQGAAANNTGIGSSVLQGLTTGGNNTAVGYSVGDNITTGSTNIMIGYNIDAQVATASNQMSIGNLIFASGGFGTGTTVGTGFVGIRTALPRVTLDITGTDAMMIPAGNNSTNRPAASAVANGMIRYNTTDTRFEGYQNGSWLPFSSSAAGGSVTAAGSNLQVQINNGGSLGATSGLTFTSATNTLTVGGTVSITGTSGLAAPTGMALSNLSDVSVTGLATGKVLAYNGTAWAPATAAGGTPGGSTTQVQFNNAGAFAGDSALTWDNTNKYLAVNTASPNSNIHITATSFNAMRLQNAPGMDVYVDVLTTDGHNPYLRFGTNNISQFSLGANDADGTFRIGAANDFSTTLLMLDGSGNLTVANNISYSGVLTDTSDRRLKTDIHSLKDKGSMLDRINQIDTFTYRMKKDTKLVQYGVMAQQVKDIFPELVITDTKTPENYMSVNYTGLIAPLIESTKELKAQNDNLKSRVAALEAQQKETHADIESLSRDIKGMKAYTGYGIGKAGMDGWMMLMMGLVFGGGGMAFAYRSGIRVRRQK